jgi:AraC-like DNA-binding protein
MSDPRILARAVARHAPEDGTFKSAIPGVALIRASAPTLPMPVIYEPTVCFVAQGRKRAMLAHTACDYDPARHLIASVGLPVMGAVLEASASEPYLCVQLDLDMQELSELAIRFPAASAAPAAAPEGLTLNRTTPALLDALVRLVSLLDTPVDIEAIAPLAIREILYRLLSGDGGHVIRHMAQTDSRLNQIARAIVWIRRNYRERWRIEAAAEVAALSRSTFHAHFKAITAMSPLEFRTQLRLQEARRLMVSDAMEAAAAAFNVGYDSPSQFSRDYSRFFGTPPAADTRRLRAAIGAAGSA